VPEVNLEKGRLRVAVIGADPDGRGFGARAHVPAVRAAAGLELTAVCTSRQETASRAAERWRLPRWYSDYEQLLADPAIDLVTVAVRVRLHFPIVEAALRAGKLVYCEWPLGLGSGEDRRLAALAQRRRSPTAVGLQGRFSPSVQYARQLIEQGTIGRPLSFVAAQLLDRFPVESGRWWLAREEEGSGALHVATGHVTDVVESLLGPVAALAGTRATMLPCGTFSDTKAAMHWTASDTVAYVARLKSGCLGSIFTTYLSQPPGGFSLRIFGDSGQLSLEAPGYVSYSPPALYLATRAGRNLRRVRVPRRFFGGVRLDEDHPGVNVALALQAFAKAARSGSRFRPDFEDAVRVHALLEHVASARLQTVGCPRPSRRSRAGRPSARG
jgi:predicted dehydrogenase